jgi:tetratricopeptide (TPR) repeat protein
MSPAKMAELVAACAESKTFEDGKLFAFERALRAAGRIDEAITAFRTRTVYQGAEYVELALALIAQGRAEDAIAIGEQLAKRTTIRDFDWARGWVLVAAGRLDDGRRVLAKHVAHDTQIARQQYVAALHRGKTTLPEDLTFVIAPAELPMFAETDVYELVSHLYAIADEGHDALDAAIRALSYAGLRRAPQKHANHQANLRIRQALCRLPTGAEPTATGSRSTCWQSCLHSESR